MMHNITEVSHAAGVKTRDGGLDTAQGLSETCLRVSHVMNEDVITASPTATVFMAAKTMFASSVSCVVVVSDNLVVGILTEKDLLKAVARADTHLRQLSVQERMSHPVETVHPDLPLLDAGEIMQAKRIKRLPVVLDQRLVGIVTQTDITRALIGLSPLQQVSEIMSTDIATVTTLATAADAARVMSARNISCVVVTHHNEVAGIFTQKDLLRRVIAVAKNPTDTQVTDVMSCPILPVPSHYSVFTANRAMDKMHIHRLVVEDENGICGIVSQTDIIRAVEKRLQEELTRQQLLTDSAIPMCGVDPNGNIIYVNAGFLTLFELTNDEQVLNKPFLPARFWLNPQDRNRFFTEIEKKDSEMVQLALKTSTGRDKHVLVLMALTRGAHGEISGWQAVLCDISGRKHWTQDTDHPPEN